MIPVASLRADRGLPNHYHGHDRRTSHGSTNYASSEYCKRRSAERKMGYSLRLATVDDLAFMERVFVVASHDVTANHFGLSDAVGEHLASTRSYDFEHTTIIVVDGFDRGWQTIVMRGVNEMHIDSIFLLPEAQRQGIGSKIIRGHIAEAQARNFAISVCAIKANEGALRLYERLGFTIVWSDGMRVCMLFQGSDD